LGEEIAYAFRRVAHGGAEIAVADGGDEREMARAQKF
jgi:hypothetical protein